jgi:hypothetical protein
MSDDFPDWRCVGTQINSSKGLPKSSWAHLPDNEKSEPMENTWVMSRVVWKDALEVFGNHFPHFRVERSAGETILCSSCVRLSLHFGLGSRPGFVSLC